MLNIYGAITVHRVWKLLMKQVPYWCFGLQTAMPLLHFEEQCSSMKNYKLLHPLDLLCILLCQLSTHGHAEPKLISDSLC